MLSDIATELSLGASPFTIRLNSSDAPLHARALIVATGAAAWSSPHPPTHPFGTA